MSGNERKNLNRKERERLITVIKLYRVIHNKSRSKVISSAKDKAWAEICQKFNENSPENYHVSSKVLFFIKNV